MTYQRYNEKYTPHTNELRSIEAPLAEGEEE
jgi:hypothetical protein